MNTIKKRKPGTKLRKELEKKGWNARTAAMHLGLHWSHVCRCINGERKSQSLEDRIAALPERKEGA